jgi:beta-glucanase (GH16 family)
VETTINTAALHLTFDDEFNSFVSSPDGSAGWMTAYPFGGENARTLVPNHEAEYYSDPSVGEDPFSLSNGVLSITATPAAPGSNPYNLPYDSGVITTYKSFSQLYGYFEVRAELPAGQGLWPAFWMLPASNVNTSELDVFEVLGNAAATIYETTHDTASGTDTGQQQVINGTNTSTGFHTYGVDWEPNTITFYIDGQAVATDPTPASMDQPMYMLLDLAVGGTGSWPGAPASSSEFPAALQIDYVRAYATANTVDVSGTDVVSSSNTFTLDGIGTAAARGAGNYTVTGNASGGTLTLGNGNDSINLTGGGDTITVGAGDSTITALGADNLITAGPGMSFITVDTSSGNKFVTNAAGQGLETISGFTSGDVLDLAQTLAGLNVASNLSNLGSYVTAVTQGGSTTLLVNPSGSGTASAFVQLNGVNTTVAGLVNGHNISLT